MASLMYGQQNAPTVHCEPIDEHMSSDSNVFPFKPYSSFIPESELGPLSIVFGNF